MAEDVDGFFEMDSNPKVHTYLGNKPLKSIKESKDMIEMVRQQYIDRGIGRWTMIEKATNSFVGWTGFQYFIETINGHTNYYDLGYRLPEKHWGKGFATESAKACIQYGFEKMNLENIYAVAAIGNTGSINVLEKSGLTKGEIVDCLLYTSPSPRDRG